MIIVDKIRYYGQKPEPGGERYFGNGKPSCHMSCDGDLEELHRFAQSIGLRREWFQNHRSLPHYDLTPNKRAQALRAGAVEMGDLEQMDAWRVSQGLEPLKKSTPLVFGEANPKDYLPKMLRSSKQAVASQRKNRG